MAIYYRDYYGVADDTVSSGDWYIGGVFKFSLTAGYNYTIDALEYPLRRVMFNISAGVVLPNTAYNNLAATRILNTGDYVSTPLVKVEVVDLNNNSISGIGSFAEGTGGPYGGGSRCTYEFTSTGVLWIQPCF